MTNGAADGAEFRWPAQGRASSLPRSEQFGDAGAAPAPDCGVIFAATGARYMAMARNAAESVRRHCPDLPIHLYCGEDVSAPCFDRVTSLEKPWRRSKIDAMLDAPFERNLFLDADVFVVADITDVFGLLNRFDIALAHDQERNSRHARAVWRTPFPASFPQFNSGVIAFRRSDAVLQVLRAWRKAVRDGDLPRDQGALRELLWDSDLRIATLPPEYNLMDMSSVISLRRSSLAPRIIHHYAIQQARRSGLASNAEELLGSATAEAMEFMRRRDHFLGGPAASRDDDRRDRWTKRMLQIRMALDIVKRRLRSWFRRLRKWYGGLK